MALFKYYTLHQAWYETWCLSSTEKTIYSHKVCSKCPPPARIQGYNYKHALRKRVHHWSTASSISELLQAAPHMQYGRCRSSSMSWTLVSLTRCWMTDHSARHVATGLTRPQSVRLCDMVCHKECIIILYWLTLKSGFGVLEGHWKRRGSIDHIWLPISTPL